MKKKRSTRLTVSFSDVLVGIICFVGMFYCLFLFWQDINVTFSRSNEEPIAVIYFKKNTAQRKLLNSNIWERLRTASPIYNGDKIRTASMSEAYTIFNDCSKIDLHENSLIQVFSKKDKNSVEFISGSISVLSTPESKNEGMKVQTGNKILNFTEDASAVISISPKNANQAIITVTSGAVQMEEKTVANVKTDSVLSNYLPNLQSFVPENTTTLTTIEAGNCIVYEPVTFVPQLKTEIESAVVKPVEAYVDFSVTMPTSSYSITRSVNKSQYVPFFWSGSNEIQVEFATDASFNNIIETKHLVSASGRSSISMDFAQKEDTIFWRAYPLPLTIDSPQTQSKEFPRGIIFIQEPQEMKMLNPMMEVFGDSKAAEKMESAIIKNEEKASNEILEIINLEEKAQKEEIKEPEPAIEEPKEEIVAEEEKPVQVSIPPVTKPAPAKKPEAPAKKAEPKKAEIKNPTPEIPKPAVDKTPKLVSETSLTSPSKGVEYTEEDFLVDNPEIVFKWKDVGGASNYSFEIKSSGGKSIISKTVEANSYTVKDDDLAIFDNGTYTWSVTANTTVDGKKYSSKTAQSTFSINISEIESAEVDVSNLLQ